MRRGKGDEKYLTCAINFIIKEYMMNNILVIGAGKSSSELVRFLSRNALKEKWNITVADADINVAKEKFNSFDNITFAQLNIDDVEKLSSAISSSDIVISLMPPVLHVKVAQHCIANKKPLVTASYISPDMQQLDEEAKNSGVLLLNEMGVDPGIDHMSAMQIIDRIKYEGGTLTAFESFTGGLLAPESEKDNPWKYKFTWNPKNVVTAGQGMCKFIQENRYKYIPYHRLFRRTEIINIPGYGLFEGYGNRDSLHYRELYGLENVKTIYRGTLRRTGFCRAWDTFVQLGATDDTYTMHNSENMTYRDFINSFLYYHPTDSVELKLALYMKFDLDSEEMYRLRWLGIFDEVKKVELKNATPAQILQKILEDKWSLEPDDKDMLVMWHKFNYLLDGKEHELHSSMVALGEDLIYTAMAKTVGLPLGIAVKLMLNGKINLTGVHIPVKKEIYEPVLKELKEYEIEFNEQKIS
jgi:saccharopine dehydrogenase-like NADP-dependent oxidoreductase